MWCALAPSELLVGLAGLERFLVDLINLLESLLVSVQGDPDFVGAEFDTIRSGWHVGWC